MDNDKSFVEYMNSQCEEIRKTCHTEPEIFDWIQKNSKEFRSIYMTKKTIWKSKTFWVNAVTIGIAVANEVFKVVEVDPNLSLAVLGALNVILRIVTYSAVKLK